MQCPVYHLSMLRSYKGRLPVVHPTAYVHRIRIGRRSNVQDGTVVHVMRGTHPTTIGDEVTIGHGALVHGCTLRDRILIGMGAILLNGVDVGEDSIVAAGTLLPEGTPGP